MKWTRLKHVADIRVSTVDKKSADGQIPVALCNYTDVYYNDRIVAEMPFMLATATKEQVERFSLRADDVLITKDSETADDIAIPAHVTSDLDGVVCGYHLAVLRPNPRRLSGRYLDWALRAAQVREQFTLSASGVTRFGLRYDSIANVTLPTPALDRQLAIADYLARETGEIDRLIEEKERLISLIAERRASRADDLVLGSHARETHSTGIEWWPSAPTHWEIRGLSTTVTDCRNGVWGDDPDGGSDDVACVRVADFDRARSLVRDGVLTMRSVPRSDRERHQLRRGDLLLEKSGGGDLQPVGKVVMYQRTDDAVCSNFIARMPVAARHEPAYLRHLHDVLYRRRINTRSIKQSTGIQNLDSEGYLAERVAVPPLEEQRALALQLDSELAAWERLTESIRRQVGCLRERRGALIAAAVTGQRADLSTRLRH